MRITEILDIPCVKVPLESTDKQGVIFELVDLLAAQTELDDPETLKQAVWSREQTRTTGIGHGVAIPHGKAPGCPALCMAVGVPAEPLEFGSIDGKPVKLVFLLASPTDQTGPHIQALASISRMLTDDNLREQMQNASSAEGLYQLIQEHEAATETG